jgi:hypothetical protein
VKRTRSKHRRPPVDDGYDDLVARGALRPPSGPIGWTTIEKMPTVRVSGKAALDAMLRDRYGDGN